MLAARRGRSPSALIDERRLGADSLVVEVASNDGYLLQNYQRRRRAGARHRAGARTSPRSRASSTASRRVTSSSAPTLAARLAAEGLRADVFHAHNVLAHVPDLNGFVAGIAHAAQADDGVAVIEVPYVKDMIDHCEFDTIYHEHLCYFSLTALDRLFRRHGLAICRRRAACRSTAARCGIVAARRGSAADAAVGRACSPRRSGWGVRPAEPYPAFAAAGRAAERRDLRRRCSAA